MEINVKMTTDEFLEFMEWQKDRDKYEREAQRLRRAPQAIALSLRNALEPVPGKKGKFKIVEQEHMADAWDMAEEFLPD